MIFAAFSLVSDASFTWTGCRFEDSDPAGNWLKSAILSYASGQKFEPRQSITPEQLMSVLEAPIVTGSADTNRANDTNAN